MSKPRQFYDQSKAHEAEHARRVKAAADAYPHKSLAEAMDFAENLRDAAVAGINAANAAVRAAETQEESDFAAHERSHWKGVADACTAIRRATTISR